VKDGLENSPDVGARLALVKMPHFERRGIIKFLKDHEPTDAELHAQYNTVVASGRSHRDTRDTFWSTQDKADKLIKKINDAPSLRRWPG